MFGLNNDVVQKFRHLVVGRIYKIVYSKKNRDIFGCPLHGRSCRLDFIANANKRGQKNCLITLKGGEKVIIPWGHLK